MSSSDAALPDQPQGLPPLLCNDTTPAERVHSGSAPPSLRGENSITPSCEDLTSSTEIQDMVFQDEVGTSEGGEDWIEARSSKKRRKRHSGSDSSSQTVILPTSNDLSNTAGGLTVLFVPVSPNHRITALSSIKVSETLEKLCPECITEVRYNFRLNLIAVDTRNGMSTNVLLKCSDLCGIQVRAYQPLGHPAITGIIKNVDAGIQDEALPKHVRSTVRLVKMRRLGQSTVIKLTFYGDKLPEYVSLGHVRHQVFPFTERPIQCNNCCRFGHREAVCNRPAACSTCGEAHRSTTSESKERCKAQLKKCVNCGSAAHMATSPLCPKWLHERAVLQYAKAKGVDHRSARSAINQTAKTGSSVGVKPLSPKDLPVASTSVQQRLPQSGASTSPPSYANIVKRPQKHPLVVAQPLPDTKEPSIPSEEGSSSVPDVIHHPKKPSSSDSSVSEGLPPATYTTLITIVIDMVCKLLSKIEAPWAQSLHTLVRSIIPFFTGTSGATMSPTRLA